jgi:hypothetical protein
MLIRGQVSVKNAARQMWDGSWLVHLKLIVPFGNLIFLSSTMVNATQFAPKSVQGLKDLLYRDDKVKVAGRVIMYVRRPILTDLVMQVSTVGPGHTFLTQRLIVSSGWGFARKDHGAFVGSHLCPACIANARVPQSKDKFLSAASFDGFGFCSVILYVVFRISNSTFTRSISGWDLHDAVYSRELLISNAANGYRDLIATIDLSTFRRIPWENNVPFFLVSFLDPETKEPVSVCPRGVLRKLVGKAEQSGWQCVAGIEFEVRAPEVGTIHD